MSSPSTSSQQQSTTKYLPFRSLNDFLTDTKQYGVPNLKKDKFDNRVLSNLLYFQTNYLATAGSIILLFLLCGFKKMIVGALTLAPAVGLGLRQFGLTRVFEQLERQSPHAVTAITLIEALVLYLAYNSVVYFVVSLLIPIGVCIAHAAFKKRGIINKGKNAMESAGVAVYEKTPMGILLRTVGLQTKVDDED